MGKLWRFLIFSDFAFNNVNKLLIEFISSQIEMKIKQLKIIKQSLEIILGMLLFLISYFLEGGLLHQQQSFHQPVGQLPGGLTPVVHHLHIFQPQLTCFIFIL